MIRVNTWLGIIALGATVALSGCAKEVENESEAHADHSGHDHETTAAGEPSPELKQFVVTEGAPAAVVGVAQARQSVPDGETIALEGRLKDFVSGKAAFTVVDGRIKSCIEMSDGCETPWDYCCIPQDVMSSNTATVTLVDAEGKMLDGNLQGVNSIDNLSTVVVTGKVNKDPDGNMTVAADKVYLR